MKNEFLVDVKRDADRWTVGYGYTMNLGNFQSLRVDVSYSSSAEDGESVEDHYERVCEETRTRFFEKIKEEQREAGIL